MRSPGPSLRVVALDLDGVVYRGDAVLPGVPETVRALAERGLAVRFVTNNATLHRSQVALKLRRLGVPAEPGQVLSSAAGAAAWLRERLSPGSRVAVVGEAGLVEELRDAGLDPQHAEEGDLDGAAALAVGLDRAFTYRAMARAQAVLATGVPFVATNDDTTLPVEGRLLPGAGALVAGIAVAAGRHPEVIIGKPSLELARALARDTGVPYEAILFVGDRLETDIAMAGAAGMRSALVLTGVSRREDLAQAAAVPDLVLDTLPELLPLLDRL